MQTYIQIFLSAAIPQRLAFLAFLAAVIVSGVMAANRMRAEPTRRPPVQIAHLGLLLPMLGLLVAAWNVLHMMHTTLMLPSAPTLKMLAPGLMETAALIAAGALSGLVCVVLNAVLEARFSRHALKS